MTIKVKVFIFSIMKYILDIRHCLYINTVDCHKQLNKINISDVSPTCQNVLPSSIPYNVALICC